MEDKCYMCNGDLKGEYQVMIFEDGKKKFAKCCNRYCADNLKEKNQEELYDMYMQVNRQCIQKLKSEYRTNREVIEGFIKASGYTYNVEDILDGYKRYMNDEYVSYSMERCISELSLNLDAILRGVE